MMLRTKHRPIPSGKLRPESVLLIGGICSGVGLVYLALAVNLTTAALGAVTLTSYLFLYTPLKRITPLNTVIGAIPGALPPLMGVKAFYLLYGKAGTFPQLLGQIFGTSPAAFALTGLPGVLLVHGPLGAGVHRLVVAAVQVGQLAGGGVDVRLRGRHLLLRTAHAGRVIVRWYIAVGGVFTISPAGHYGGARAD